MVHGDPERSEPGYGRVSEITNPGKLFRQTKKGHADWGLGGLTEGSCCCRVEGTKGSSRTKQAVRE